MSNQHAGFSQVLAEQRITEWQEWAAQARLARAGRRPGVGTDQPVHRPTAP